MIEICGNLVWDLPCVQQAIYLEGGPLMCMLPLYLHINKKSDYDDMMMMMKSVAELLSDRPKMFAGQKQKFACFVRQSCSFHEDCMPGVQ